MLLILTGKTASGKDTIKQKLLSRFPNFKKAITTTSRTPRSGEVQDVDYHFLTREKFEDKIKAGEFAEHVEYGGNLYGTYKKELEQALDGDALWRIDPSRAGEVRDFIRRSFPDQTAEKLLKNILVIYVTVSDDVVLQRLKQRGLSDEEIQKRMEDDAKIWQQYQNSYDFIVGNVPGKLDQTLDKIFGIIGNQNLLILPEVGT